MTGIKMNLSVLKGWDMIKDIVTCGECYWWRRKSVCGLTGDLKGRHGFCDEGLPKDNYYTDEEIKNLQNNASPILYYDRRGPTYFSELADTNEGYCHSCGGVIENYSSTFNWVVCPFCGRIISRVKEVNRSNGKVH